MPSLEYAPDGSLRQKDNGRDRGQSWQRKRDRIIKEQDYCYLCGELVDKDLPGTDPMGPSIDHRLAVSKGGDDSWDNLFLAHLECNKRRGAKDIDEVRYTPHSRAW